MNKFKKLLSLLTAFTFLATTFAPAGFAVPTAMAAPQDIEASLTATNPESITFTNNGSETVDLSDYGFGDENNNNAYSLAGVVLTSGSSYTFCETSETCDDPTLSGSGTWNDGGDTLFITENGSEVASQDYSDAAAESPIVVNFQAESVTPVTTEPGDDCSGDDFGSDNDTLPVENTDTGEDFTTIQEAIDDCGTDDGDVIEVDDGTYPEIITVDKELTIQSENSATSTIIEGRLLIEASNTTIDGFTVTQSSTDPSPALGIVLTDNGGLYSDVVITNNIVDGYEENDTIAGIWLEAGSNVEVSNNEITNLTSLTNTAQGILIGASDESLDNISILNNKISNIEGGDTKGAFGITVNEDTNDLVVENNEITNLGDASYTVGIGLDADTPNVVVRLNDFENFSAINLPPVAISVNKRTGNDADVSTMTIEQNNFFFDESEGVAGVNYDVGTTGETDILSAEENYWNDSEGPAGPFGETDSDGALVGEQVDYNPWLCEEAESSETSVDGSCDDDAPAESEITNPSEGEEVSGTITLEATYVDENGDNDDEVKFAVRQGSCDASNPTVFGNVNDQDDDFQFDGTIFTAEFDSTQFDNGDYCFAFNPVEDEDDSNIRLTQNFTINNSDQTEQCEANHESNLVVTGFDPVTGMVTIENTSDTCVYDVGIASYKAFEYKDTNKTNNDNNLDIDTQELFDSELETLDPSEPVTFNIDVPSCAYQIDVFYGDLIEDFNGQRYGDRKLGGAHEQLLEENLCEEEGNNSDPDLVLQCFAGEVVSANQGQRADGTDVPADRSVESKATGPDSQPDEAIDFYSLGIGGDITIEFEQPLQNVAGDDIRVFETSYGNPTVNNHPEKAEVYASVDGINYELLGVATVDNTNDPNANYTFDLGVLPEASFIKIVDITSPNAGPGTRDGFDVAGVGAVECGGEPNDNQCFAEIELDVDVESNVDVLTDTNVNIAPLGETADEEGEFSVVLNADNELVITLIGGSDQLRNVSGEILFSGGALLSTPTITPDSVEGLELGSTFNSPDTFELNTAGDGIVFDLFVTGGDDIVVVSGLEAECEINPDDGDTPGDGSNQTESASGGPVATSFTSSSGSSGGSDDDDDDDNNEGGVLGASTIAPGTASPDRIDMLERLADLLRQRHDDGEVLGDQVAVMPVGGVATGHGGTAPNQSAVTTLTNQTFAKLEEE